MEGVNCLDQIVGHYRIFIKSRKWTLGMIFQSVDLATAGWNTEKMQRKQKSTRTLDPLHFKIRIL
jgi:hypothetical protein